MTLAIFLVLKPISVIECINFCSRLLLECQLAFSVPHVFSKLAFVMITFGILQRSLALFLIIKPFAFVQSSISAGHLSESIHFTQLKSTLVKVAITKRLLTLAIRKIICPLTVVLSAIFVCHLT